MAFLGERSQLTRDSARGKAGTVTHASAILDRAVVDTRGQEPQPNANRHQDTPH
ncbi:hypothetical protein [Streptomyces sp. NPDC093225]|uniref:hypothetical protein n=1 Tax=Streptomyces sp. NPDC093225 TaxID=3366034 RepID=UPI00381F8026